MCGDFSFFFNHSLLVLGKEKYAVACVWATLKHTYKMQEIHKFTNFIEAFNIPPVHNVALFSLSVALIKSRLL